MSESGRLRLGPEGHPGGARRRSEPPQRANVAYSEFDLGGSIVMVPDAGGDRFNVVVIYSGQQYQRELN